MPIGDSQSLRRRKRFALSVIVTIVLIFLYPSYLLATTAWRASQVTLDPSYYNQPKSILPDDPNFWDYQVIQFYQDNRNLVANFTTLSVAAWVAAYFIHTRFIDLGRPAGIILAQAALESNSTQEIFMWLQQTNTRLFLIPTPAADWRYAIYKNFEQSKLFQLIIQKTVSTPGECYTFQLLTTTSAYQIVMLQESVC